MSSDEKKKIISLEVLEYYDEKIKDYIKAQGCLPEDEIKKLIKAEVDNQGELEII